MNTHRDYTLKEDSSLPKYWGFVFVPYPRTSVNGFCGDIYICLLIFVEIIPTLFFALQRRCQHLQEEETTFLLTQRQQEEFN